MAEKIFVENYMYIYDSLQLLLRTEESLKRSNFMLSCCWLRNIFAWFHYVLQRNKIISLNFVSPTTHKLFCQLTFYVSLFDIESNSVAAWNDLSFAKSNAKVPLYCLGKNVETRNFCFSVLTGSRCKCL